MTYMERAWFKARHDRRRQPDEVDEQFRVICTNKRHQITLTKHGSLILEGHPPERRQADLVQEAFSGQQAKCLLIKRLLEDPADSKNQYRMENGGKYHSGRIRQIPDELRPLARQMDRKRWHRRRYLAPSTCRVDHPQHAMNRAMGKQLVAAKVVSTGSPYPEQRRVSLFDCDPDDRRYFLIARRLAGQLRDHLFTVAGSQRYSQLWVYIAQTKKEESFFNSSGYPKYEAVPVIVPYIDGTSFFLTDTWVTSVYRTFGWQLVEDRALPLSIIGEMGPGRYKVTAAIRKRQEYNLSVVTGVVYQRPFGRWGFMELPEEYAASSSSAA
jgi:hypothetical protein